MKWNKHTPAEIARKCQRVHSAIKRGKSVAAAAAGAGISASTYFRWRRLYGDLNATQLQKLIALRAENDRLRRVLGELNWAERA